MNHRTMFATYPMGFADYERWSEYVHDMWDKHDFGCDRFGEDWLRLWEAVGKLLETSGIRECRFESSQVWYAADRGMVGQMLRQSTMYDLGLSRRVVLLDGTIIKEWTNHRSR